LYNTRCKCCWFGVGVVAQRTYTYTYKTYTTNSNHVPTTDM